MDAKPAKQCHKLLWQLEHFSLREAYILFLQCILLFFQHPFCLLAHGKFPVGSRKNFVHIPLFACRNVEIAHDDKPLGKFLLQVCVFLFQISQHKLLTDLFLLSVPYIAQQGLVPFILPVKLLFVRSTVPCALLKLLLILYVFDIQQTGLILAHNVAGKGFLKFFIEAVFHAAKPVQPLFASADLCDEANNRVIQPLLPVLKFLLLLCLLLIRLLIFFYLPGKSGSKLFIMPAERISKRFALWF